MRQPKSWGAVPAAIDSGFVGPQSEEMMNTISAEHPGGMTLSDHDAQFAIDPPGGFDPLEDLLVTISEALCVREVLPRVSQIANRVLRHDGLELVVRDQDGQVTMQARLPDGLPAHRLEDRYDAHRPQPSDGVPRPVRSYR
jgi:hypothetical protein